MRGLRQPHAHATVVDVPSAFELPPSSPPSAPHAPATGRLKTTSAGTPCFHLVPATHLRHALSIPSTSLPKKTETGNQRRCRFHHWLAGRWGGGRENPPGRRLNAGIPATLSAESVARTRLLSDPAATSAAQYGPQIFECQAPSPTKVCLPPTS